MSAVEFTCPKCGGHEYARRAEGAVMKYIRHRESGFFLFPDTVRHVDMAHAVCAKPSVELVSAGFVNKHLCCVGESVSVGLVAHPEDTLMLRRQLGSEV